VTEVLIANVAWRESTDYDRLFIYSIDKTRLKGVQAEPTTIIIIVIIIVIIIIIIIIRNE